MRALISTLSVSMGLSLLSAAVPALASANPTMYFKSQHEKFFVEPSGDVYTKGVLSKLEDGSYLVNDKKFKAIQGKRVNGTGFNLQSLEYFLGKNVEVILATKGSDLVLHAIVPADLYSSTEINVLTRQEDSHLNEMIDIKTGRLKGMSRSKKFENRSSFRATLVNKQPVRAGDSAFIITLSGHQGDDNGSLGGHFAFGRGQVGSDGQLYSELSNFYPLVNEKEIKAGHINLIDYFGNITAGQNNYRPTWTAIIYGLSGDELVQAQNKMNDVFEFLAASPKFSFSYLKNCSTESVNTLREAGVDIFATPEAFKFVLLERIQTTLNLNKITNEKLQTPIAFAFKDKAQSMPRRTFEKALAIALSDFGANSGITRIDFIYQGQYLSQRRLGGLPVGSLKDAAGVLPLFIKKKK